MNTAKELLEVLHLDTLDKNIFIGRNHDQGARHVFGGQVLSQALHAAIVSVPEERVVHSMHGYFVLPGDLNHPIIYIVEDIREGRSFTTRRVRAVQHGEDIFIMAASFQLIQEGLEHQCSPPDVPRPEELLSDQDLIQQYADVLPDPLKRFLRTRPIEFRPVHPENFIATKDLTPSSQVWLRAKGPVPNELGVHHRILAYASDYNLLFTALMPHQSKFNPGNVRMASLDHAIWFHRPFKMDEWLLYATDSPSAGNARGFTRGLLYNVQGDLVASVTQEGMIRAKLI